jgi:BCD family chlorophyll transporter-like MFS transporter
VTVTDTHRSGATATAGQPVLRLRDVTVDLGSVKPLDRVDLDVDAGEVVAVVGPNGAGKTTLLDVVTGDVGAAGAVTVPPAARIARVFQGSPLPDTLTVGELFDLVTGGGEVTDELAATFGLAEHLDARVAHLSTGMRRIADLAVSTVGDHDLLLLDEPASGLADAEIDHLAALVDGHRRRRDVAVLVVEHNRRLVERLADRVVGLDRGRVVTRGDGASATAEVHRSSAAPSVRSTLARIAEAGAPAPPAARHEVSTWTKLRLGLREFAAGMSSVLVLGVLNRVMKVELGISLVVVATVLASYNLAAPAALAVGHRSDQRPILGRHRAPYIVGGAALTAVVLAAAPHLADLLARGVDPWSVGVMLAAFVVMGVGMYGGGTVYFALIADITPRDERGHAASVVYLMLMAGIVSGAALAAVVLDDAAAGRHSLFAIVAVLVVALNVAAVWGLDPREVDEDDLPERTSAWLAVREIAAIGAARRFFAFTLAATVFLFLQQAVLEPFGGDVLGLSVRATTGFNAVQTIGVLVGMLVTGRGIADRAGHKRTATVGLVGSTVAFTALAGAALSGSVEASWLGVLLVGLTTGLFNVAVLALMMAMSVPERVALFMGAWTVSHALADGVATAGGGLLHDLVLRVASADVAYASVFALEAVGLALCIPLLHRIDVDTFAKDVAADSARRSAVAMGWVLPPAGDTSAGTAALAQPPGSHSVDR